MNRKRNNGVNEEIRILRLDLNEAYRRGDKPAVANIQFRIDGLTKKD